MSHQITSCVETDVAFGCGGFVVGGEVVGGDVLAAYGEGDVAVAVGFGS